MCSDFKVNMRKLTYQPCPLCCIPVCAAVQALKLHQWRQLSFVSLFWAEVLVRIKFDLMLEMLTKNANIWRWLVLEQGFFTHILATLFLKKRICALYRFRRSVFHSLYNKFCLVWPFRNIEFYFVFSVVDTFGLVQHDPFYIARYP